MELGFLDAMAGGYFTRENNYVLYVYSISILKTVKSTKFVSPQKNRRCFKNMCIESYNPPYLLVGFHPINPQPLHWVDFLPVHPGMLDDRYVAFVKSLPWFLPSYYTPVGVKVPLPLFIKVLVGRMMDDNRVFVEILFIQYIARSLLACSTDKLIVE